MAKRGLLFTFHGAFGSKAKAAAKERKLGKGAFVKRIEYRKKRKDGKRGKLQNAMDGSNAQQVVVSMLALFLAGVNTLLNGLWLWVVNDLRHRIARLEGFRMEGGE